MLVEVILMIGSAAHEEGDAIVGAREDDFRVAGGDAIEAVAAEAIAEEDGVVDGLGRAVHSFLDFGGHGDTAEVVETLG